MPSSTQVFIPYVCGAVRRVKPRSVLDIGVGFGKYGFLVREYTDIAHQRYTNWRVRLEGIEIFPNYITDLQRMIYNEIYIGDAAEITSRLGYYDMIFFIDVIEHMPKDKGVRVLQYMKQNCRYGIVATPKRLRKQGSVNNNVHERHITPWKKQELQQYGKVTEINTTQNGILYLAIKGKRA